MKTSLGNFGKGILQGVIVFVATYGSSLIGIIPHNITTISVGSVLAFIVSWAAHSIITPAGSTVVKSSASTLKF